MYLSRIELDRSSRETVKALAAPSKFHGLVESCFPRVPDRQTANRHLWRIDRLNGKLYMLVVSPERPDFDRCAEKAYCIRKESKAYDDFLNGLNVGQQWHFRLTANPTRKRKSDSKSSGRIYNECTREQQTEWLLKRAEKNGFATDRDHCMITHVQWIHFRKSDGNIVTMQEVSYEGVLTITDRVLFLNLLTNGIGREKAYGMGLMTVADRIK